MTLTLDSMAYDIFLTIRNGRIVDDDDLDIRQIKFWIRNSRAVWIKNELNNNRPISQRFIQDFGCVELQRTDVGLCTDVGCTILSTKLDLPNFIEHKGVPVITRVGPALINQATFTVIPYERVPFIGNGRFNSNAIFAFWREPKIYLVSKSSSLNYTGMQKVNIRGIAADPENVPGYDSTKDYPISEALWTYLKDIVMKSDVSMFLATIGDVVNDSSDTTQPQEAGEKELLSSNG